jgi:hypothetical protein
MRKLTIILGSAAILVLTGCVTTKQARSVTPGGFLGESARLLRPGEKSDGFLLVYRKDKIDWKSYDKIILDPITMWSEKPSTLPPDQLADYQRLIESFHHTFSDALAKNFTIVQGAAPGALRIQTAIINGEQANSTLKIAKTIAPYAGFADALWTFATGKPAFTGEVSLEYMIKDSESGELLAAGADRRVGGNQVGKATFTTWGDVQNILTYWSDLAVYRLCMNRAAADCRKPSAGILEP